MFADCRMDSSYHGTVAIIGFGPRGLSVLERLIAIYGASQHTFNLHIHIIDKGLFPGQGVHDSTQNHHLLINTVASKITMFVDESFKGRCGPVRPGPSLYEFVNRHGYRRIVEDRRSLIPITNDDNNQYKSEVIRKDHYLPRAILGNYLKWTYKHIIENLPPGVYVYYHQNTLVDMMPLENENIRLFLENNTGVIDVNEVVLTTGHNQNQLDRYEYVYQKFVNEHRKFNVKLNYLRSYPLHNLNSINNQTTICIQGLGLSFYDVLAELTLGRGGRFMVDSSQQSKKLKYVPSGKEPKKIYVYSRQCVPHCSQKSIDGEQYKAQFFTKEWIDKIQKYDHNGNKIQFNFNRDILPMLLHEIYYCYDNLMAQDYVNRTNSCSQTYQPSNATRQVIHKLFYPLDNIQFHDFESFKSWIINYLETDVDEAKKGSYSTAVKAATAVLHVRDTIRHVVNFRGLTPESHVQFLNELCPIMSRIAGGAPIRRNKEFLALLRHGLVEFAACSNPEVKIDDETSQFIISSMNGQRQVYADVLIKAMVEPFIVERDNSLFIQNIFQRGLIRPFYNGTFHIGGIDINENQNPIDRNGKLLTHIFALGHVVEGPNWYTNILPRPFSNSRGINDAAGCAYNILNNLSSSNQCHNNNKH